MWKLIISVVIVAFGTLALALGASSQLDNQTRIAAGSSNPV